MIMAPPAVAEEEEKAEHEGGGTAVVSDVSSVLRQLEAGSVDADQLIKQVIPGGRVV